MAGKAVKRDEKTGEKIVSSEEMAGVVFVYITYYIFMHTKELNEVFKDTSGIRTKRERLFYTTGEQSALFNFSRQRFERMRTLDHFRITEDDRKTWEKKFNIDMNFFYMTRDGAINTVNKENTVLECCFEDWEEYFKKLYPRNEVERTASERWAEKRKRTDAAKNLKVTESLKNMMVNMDTYIGKPIYSMYYYIRYNKKYEARSNLETAMDLLGESRIGDWENVTEKDSEKYLEILKKHYNYIRMKREVKKIESEDEAVK
ncbi:MAG: hypothetical protein K2K46_01975 [Lachnospiraceae bacterium]|nr:hypothetical protein [Lachnospiraceae bacterium]